MVLNQDTRHYWNVHSERFHLVKIFPMKFWMCNSIMEIIIFDEIFLVMCLWVGECGLKWAVIQFCGPTFGSTIWNKITKRERESKICLNLSWIQLDGVECFEISSETKRNPILLEFSLFIKVQSMKRTGLR